MIKWIKGFIVGISSVALLVSFGVVIFYQALVEEMRKTDSDRYRRCRTTYYKERGEKE